MMQMLILAKKKLNTSFVWACVGTANRQWDARCREVMHWHTPLMVGKASQNGSNGGMEREGGIQDVCLTQRRETNKMEIRKGGYKSKGSG